MARRPSDRQRVEELLDRFEPEVRKAFLEAIDELRDGIDLQALVRALESGDVDAALRAAQIDGAAYRNLRRAIERVYIAAGEDAMDALPALRDWSGLSVGIRFDPDYPRAAEWVRQHSSTLITAIVDDQRESIRNVLDEGLRTGRSPLSVARDIAGRVDPRTRRRTVGIIGLTNSQREFVANAREELASGNPTEMKAYLRRKARNRNYDATVNRAIAAGRPVDAETLTRIVGTYHDSLLKMRADTIARNETADAVSAARQEALDQTFDAAGIADDMIERTWHTHRDGRERPSHRAMNGQKVRGKATPFVSGAGVTLVRPHDPNAPTSETMMCRCFVTVRILKPPQAG